MRGFHGRISKAWNATNELDVPAPPAGGLGGGEAGGHFGPLPLAELPPPSNVLGRAAFAVGVVAFPASLVYFISLPLGILAVFLGTLARRRIAKQPELYTGSGYATAAVICGLGAILFTLTFFGLFFLGW